MLISPTNVAAVSCHALLPVSIQLGSEQLAGLVSVFPTYAAFLLHTLAACRAV